MDKIKDSFKKLSSREKTLIYILVILLIVCFGWLILLQPQLTSHTSLKSSKDSLELQLTELKGTSSSSSTEDIKTQIMNVNQEIKALNDQFYNLMSKEDIDQLITNLTKKHKQIYQVKRVMIIHLITQMIIQMNLNHPML